MSLDKEFQHVMVLGQYAHWARLQEQVCQSGLEEGEPDSVSIARIAHRLASLYVVIEGWQTFNFEDKRIDALIAAYSTNVDLLRRCRNAVYHCQKNLFDIKIRNALKGEEMAMWTTVVQDEIECFIYMYPFFKFGVSQESYELHEEFIGCIGWEPENTFSSWNRAYLKCVDYLSENGRSPLEKSKENDALIQGILDELVAMRNKMIMPLIESRSN